MSMDHDARVRPSGACPTLPLPANPTPSPPTHMTTPTIGTHCSAVPGPCEVMTWPSTTTRESVQVAPASDTLAFIASAGKEVAVGGSNLRGWGQGGVK